MINLRFGAQALPLNPIVWRKANHVYRDQTTFSPSAINIYFLKGLAQDTDILVEAPSEMQKDFLALDFYLNCFFCPCFFLLFNKRILLLILLTQTRQLRVLLYCERVVFVEDLVFEGES